MLEKMEVKIITSEVLKLNDYVQNGMWTVLSAVDAFRPQVYVTYQYIYKQDQGGNITPSVLKNSLLQTLEYFPEFTGNIHYHPRECLLEYSNRGVSFTTAEANFCYDDIAKIDFNLRKSMLYSDEVLKTFVSPEDFLLRVKVIQLLEKSFILMMSYHHAICDTHGATWFLHAWASTTKYGHVGKYTNKTNRSILTGDGRKSIRKHRSWTFGSSFSFEDMKKKRVVVTKDLILKRQFLDDLKAKLFDEISCQNADYLTSNSVLSAILWRAIVKAKELKADAETGIGMVVECRKIFGLSDNYLGNCFFNTELFLKVDELLKTQLADVAWQIRESVKLVDKEYVNSLLNKFESAEDRRNLNPGFDTLKNDFFVSSWAKFPLWHVDFGCGKPQHFDTLSGFYSVLFVFPTKNNDNVIARLTLKEKEMESVLMNEEVKMLGVTC